jgi:hypothetical protein
MMDYDRAQRRAYRRQRRGYFGGAGGIVWLIIILAVVNSHAIWALFPLIIFGIPFFMWVIRPILMGNGQGNTNTQPPYMQPGYQQPEARDQPYAHPYQQPAYQPYTQGYTPQQPASQPHETYQEGGQIYQYEEDQQQPHTQQYEEPLTMYPQE